VINLELRVQRNPEQSALRRIVDCQVEDRVLDDTVDNVLHHPGVLFQDEEIVVAEHGD
jgi:hypothetical protein